jgi:hypothetical protein
MFSQKNDVIPMCADVPYVVKITRLSSPTPEKNRNPDNRY